MSDRRRARRLGHRAALAAAVIVMPVVMLTGCGAGWWTPIAQEATPSDVIVTPTPEATVDTGPAPTLDVTAGDVPGLWNAVAASNGLAETLPDPLVADDTTDGVSSLTVPVGDGTLFMQWQADDGRMLILEVDAPVSEDPTTSAAVPALEALAGAGLGLAPKDAQAFIASTLGDAVANAIDPTFIDWTVPSAAGDFALTIASGAGTFIITPPTGDAATDAPSDGAATDAPSDAGASASPASS